jgi:hypothetical protein
MIKKLLSTALACTVFCSAFYGCTDEDSSYYVPFTDYRQPIDNAIEALKNRDGKMMSRSFFSKELVQFEAEIWSNMTVSEYYSSLDSYLSQIDEYYRSVYGDDYVLEYTDGVKMGLEDDELDEVAEKYNMEANGKRNYNFTQGYLDYGTLTISGSLGSDSSETDLMLIYSDREGWICYLTDTFFAEFVPDSDTDSE